MSILQNKKNISDNTSLEERIRINKKYTLYDFNKWTFSVYKFKSKMDILDIGCGNGAQIIEAKKKLKNTGSIIGVDISKSSINKIKKKNFSNVYLFNADMDNILKINKIKHKRFDLIHSTYAIYYSNNPKKLLLGLKNYLKKNGRLIINVPDNSNSLIKLLKIKEKKLKYDYIYFQNFFNKYFRKRNYYHLNNELKITKYEDFFSFFRSSSLYTKKRERFIKKIILKSFKKNGFFSIKRGALF